MLEQASHAEDPVRKCLGGGGGGKGNVIWQLG